MKNNELPIGFVMALAQNENAAKQYAGLNDAQKESLVKKAKEIKTKQEMKTFIDNMGIQY